MMGGVRASVSGALKANDYPGRGLVLARTDRDGICVVYFLTGRSRASRERVLVRDGDALDARPRSATGFDPLRHYRAATVGPDWCVIGNGGQVDAVNDVWAALPADLRVAAAVIEPHSPDPLRTPPLSTS